MSMLNSINVTLNAKYSKENIIKVLSRGKKKGLIYYADYTGTIINEELAAERVMHALENNDLPSICISLNNNGALISFYKSTEDCMEFHLFDFYLDENQVGLGDDKFNWSYYIMLAIDMSQDFSITSLNTSRL